MKREYAQLLLVSSPDIQWVQDAHQVMIIDNK